MIVKDYEKIMARREKLKAEETLLLQGNLPVMAREARLFKIWEECEKIDRWGGDLMELHDAIMWEMEVFLD